MPETEVVLYAADGKCPFLDWMDKLPPKVQIKCTERVERLRRLGHELRRPEADYLRGDIHELRVRFMSVNYRILYFFSHGKAVLSHGTTKEAQVPEKEIEQAIRRRKLFELDEKSHTYYTD